MADEWNVLRLIQWTTGFFEKKGIDTPRLEAEVLLAHVMELDRFHLYTRFDAEPSREQLDGFRKLVSERARHCPTQYLLGRSEFCSRSFKVGRDVLVPRPETEHLVERAVELAKGFDEPVVVDIGTGSGCIAICIALECARAKVYATDISPQALAIAAENAAEHGVGERVRLAEGDLFGALEGEGLEGRVNILASNPPYISRRELAEVMPEVRDWEPLIALDGGEDGLDVVRRIAQGASSLIAPGGWLLLEIGAGQADEARQIVEAGLDCEKVELIQDLQRIPRVLVALMK